jgi:hypothetical protein
MCENQDFPVRKLSNVTASSSWLFAQLVIPAEAGIQTYSFLVSGFPFSRLRAEALRRASTGMTLKGSKFDFKLLMKNNSDTDRL